VPSPTDASRARRLRERLARDYELTDQPTDWGDIRVTLARVRDPDAVLDRVSQAETERLARGEPGEPARLPYWAAVWESADAVAEMLGTRHLDALLGRDLTGLSALDLGCGTGTTAVALLARGLRVTAVDIEVPALRFAQFNTRCWRGQIRLRRFDWSADNLGRRFNLIVGADVLYERDQWNNLDRCWQLHLDADGVVVLGEPHRPRADEFDAFARAAGWRVLTVQATSRPERRPVRLFVLARPVG
jgi:predicted nicotinamide N-methyase